MMKSAIIIIAIALIHTSSFIDAFHLQQTTHSSNIILAASKDDKNNSIPEVYPLSRKKLMLIDETKRLDISKGSYSSIGWSNRLGSVITPAAIPGVYTVDRPFYWNKIDVGCRCTIIQLSSETTDGNKELLIHSPVGLDPPLIDALTKLGTVTHVISPNYEHVKYAYQWANQYPNAKIWGCPGLSEKETNVKWTGEVPYGARPEGYGQDETQHNNEMWDWEEVQPIHIDIESNPFTGNAFFNEVIYYHVPSRTLLTTDLYWNYPRGDGVTNGQLVDELRTKGIDIPTDNDSSSWELAPEVGEIPLGSKLWGKVGMDKLFYPFYMNLMVKKDRRGEFECIARYITCSGWEIETIIPAHGDIVRGKELCRQVLEKHFNIQCDITSEEGLASTASYGAGPPELFN